jgi:hypothetical protein
VIELTGAELGDIRRAAEMLGVTGATLRVLDFPESAVITAVPANVSHDLLVARKTEGRLTIAIAAVVAAGALLLEFLVCRGQFTGHEQGLRIHGMCRTKESQAQDQTQQCVTP